MRILCVTMLAAFALAANADSVVRYTFDNLGDVGTPLNGCSTVQNDANLGVYDATVYGMAGMTKNTGTGPSLLYVTNGIPEAFRVFDPVAKTAAPSVDGAVRFKSNGGGQSGVMLETATDSSFFTDSFTVEALVHFPEGMANAAYGVLATQLRDDSTYVWKIWFNWNNQITFYFQDPGGSVVTNGPVVASGPFNDGKWHHIAMRAVQGESSTTVEVFYDYVLKRTSTLASRIQFPESAENSVLQIGGTTLAKQLFMGEIGEFRYSSSALPVCKFLRPRSTGNRLDADCVLYYDFEDMSDDWSWFAASSGFGAVVNKAMPGFMDGIITAGEMSGKGVLPKIDTAVPFEAMCLSGIDDKPQENTRSFYNNYQDTDHRQSNKHLSCTVTDGISLSNSNFTIEMFYKTDGHVLYWTPIFRRIQNSNSVFLGTGDNVAGKGDSCFCALVQSVSSDGLTTHEVNMCDTVQTNDGKWHHLALVRNGRSLTFYRDGDAIGSGTLEYDSLRAEGAAWYFTSGGAGSNTFNGWIDSVRVTMRALAPEEFLRAETRAGLTIFIR